MPTTEWAEGCHQPQRSGVGYLILSLSPSLQGSVLRSQGESGAFVEESTETIVMRAAERAGPRLGCSIRLAHIESADGSAGWVASGWGRFVIVFPGGEPDDAAADHIADMFCACAALSYGWTGFISQPRVAYRFPLSLLEEGDRIAAERLLAYNSDLPFDERHSALRVHLSQAMDIGADCIAETWDVASIVVGNEQLTRAVTYLDASVRKFFVFPGEVAGIMGEPELGPTACFQRAEFEEALVNVFKAVEAVIGVPPGARASVRKRVEWRARLASVGLDPEEEVLVGPDARQLASLEEAICRLSRARDERGAHGCTPWQRMTYSEMMIYQAIGISVVRSAVEKRCLLLRLVESLSQVVGTSGAMGG